MKLMLDCRAFAQLLSQSQDGAPPVAMRARMRLHLMTCKACSNIDEQMSPRLAEQARGSMEAASHAGLCGSTIGAAADAGGRTCSGPRRA
jgi:predicted anti-sigma-YlaC factor YlaD